MSLTSRRMKGRDLTKMRAASQVPGPGARQLVYRSWLVVPSVRARRSSLNLWPGTP